ncbi:MAG TPA: hypothetical protein DHU89_01395 [Flavobacteriales bacterium]|nr:hypothetical protein [Flavobacteriales bacterium]|tara:strand:+ start:14572 stop:14820 length:249 start_codon:yes stop_codon:yes gene_type:complete
MQELELFTRIKKVEVRCSLFNEITAKLEQETIIPMHYIRAAAAVFLCLISLEVFVTSELNSTTQNQISASLITETNTYLDYE